MGWWDTNVYGGDTPWDYLGHIAEAIDYKHDDDMHSLVGVSDWEPIIKYEISKLIDANLDKIRELEHTVGNTEIFYQVLGQLILDVGAIFPQDLRYHCIKCCLTDEWALEGDKHRQQEMARLAYDITFHQDGIPSPWTSDTSKHKTFMDYIKEMIQECT